MKTTRFDASAALTASAFVLAAMVFLRASDMLESSAFAEMAVNKDSITMISTSYRGDSEIIYVLDSKRGILLAYMLDPNKGVIEPMKNGALSLSRAFGADASDSSKPGTKKPR